MVADRAAARQELRVETVAVHVDDQGADFIQRKKMRRVIQAAAADLAAAAGDDIDRAQVELIFLISAVASFAAVASIDLHGGAERAGETVVAVEKIGTLVDMAVAVEHQVHAARFEDRQDVLPNLHEVRFPVGVVRSLGVGRVVEVNDDPLLGGVGEIVLQPQRHRTVGLASAGHGIERDEMDVRVVERVILAGAGSETAYLAVLRRGEDVEVGERNVGAGGLGGLVVAEDGPEEQIPQGRGIHVEHAALVL